MYRCDKCCEALDGVDGKTVLMLNENAEIKTGYEHLCLECVEANSETTVKDNGCFKEIVLKSIEDLKCGT